MRVSETSCNATRGDGSNSTSKFRSPRKNASRWVAINEPDLYVLPPTVQSLRSRTVSHWRKKFGFGVVGHVELDIFAADGEKRLGVVKRNRAVESFAEEARRVIDPRAGRHVGLFAFEHRHRVGQRRAAIPALDDRADSRCRSASRGRNRCRRRACSRRATWPRSWPRAAKIRPSTNFFASRSNSRTTLASPPPRERETRQRSYFGGNAFDPAQTQFSFSFLARASRSSTVSQAGSALRYSSSVVPPPQAARIGGILPEVVIPAAQLTNIRNPLVRIQNREHLLLDRRILRLGFQLLERDGVLRFDISHRLIASDFFEPRIGIGRCLCIDGVHGE